MRGRDWCENKVLTDGLDDLGQDDAITDVRLEVCDDPLVTGLLQVVVGPVRVDLQWTHHLH